MEEPVSMASKAEDEAASPTDDVCKEEETSLLTAIERGNDDVALSMIVNRRVDLSTINNKGETALMIAIYRGNNEIAQALLNEGADVNIADNNGETALMKAAYLGNKELVLALIYKGADVKNTDKRDQPMNIVDNNGETALMKAVVHDKTETALELIRKRNYDINIVNKNRETALMKAIDCGNNKIAHALINYDAEIEIQNDENETALMKAVYWENEEIAQALIEKKAGVNTTDKRGETVLMRAMYSADAEIAIKLIDSGADVNVADKHGKTALIKAVNCGNYKAAQVLLEKDVDVNSVDMQGNAALMGCRTAEMVELLLNNGADINITNKKGKTALMKSLDSGNKETALALIRRGADVNRQDNEGKTALMCCKDEDITRELIEREANVDIPDNKGETALMKAIDYQNDNVAIALIKENADLDVRDSGGRTALMFCKSEEMTRALIKKGANVNIADNEGETALTKAVYRDNDKIVEVLIQGGADVNNVDMKGRTPLMYCRSEGIAKSLIDKTAYVNIADSDLETALMKTVYSNRDKIAIALINADADVNIPDKLGRTPLMNCRDDRVAEALINRGAHLDILDNQGQTALMKAAGNGYENIAQALIDGGADVNIADKQGNTALVRALFGRNYKIASVLIEKGADVNMKNRKGETALMQAIYIRNDEIAVALINNRHADLNIANDEGATALMKALYDENNKIALELINKGAEVNKADVQGRTPLMCCRNVEITKALISKGADVDATDNDGETALMTALYSENNDIVFALLERDADLHTTNKQGKTALMYCRNEEVTRKLIARGAKVNVTDCSGNSALMYAVENDSVVEALIKEGEALVNQSNHIGRTPLFKAILLDNYSAQYLIEKEASVRWTDNYNLSVVSFLLHHCINKSCSESEIEKKLECLKRKGSSQRSIKDQVIVQGIINAVFCKLPSYALSTSKNMLPLLRIAVKFLKKENVEKRQALQNIEKVIEENGPTICKLPEVLFQLLDLDADVNATDENGNTAFHHVTVMLLNVPPANVLDFFHKLQDRGLFSNKKNCVGETPLFFVLSSAATLTAKEKGRLPKLDEMLEICSFLLEGPSNVNECTQRRSFVFHLLIQFFQECLNLPSKDAQKKLLLEAEKFLKLFSRSKVKTANESDDQGNSPLHIWASLCLPSDKSYTVDEDKANFELLLNTILSHLLSCGARDTLDERNQNKETPLHLCKTWSAAKLLAEAGAKTCEEEASGRQPLLSAARNQLFFKKPGCLYPDVTEEESPTFWKIAIDKGFNLWGCDKDGNSIISYLLESESFVLARGLAEVASDYTYNKSDEDLVGVLNAVCKNKTNRATWKIDLVDIILQSNRELDFNTSLRFCCMNIANEAAKKARDLTITETSGSHDRYDSCLQIHKNAQNLVSFHWEAAKRLLFQGADGESCLDLVGSCPELKDLLTKPPSFDEIPMVIPWISHSLVYQKQLAEVARRRNSRIVEGTTYWHHIDHIGYGAFGHVFAGINAKDGMEVAIKRTERFEPEHRREMRAFGVLTDCKQIVHYLAFSESRDFSYIVLELMEGNLDDYFASACYDPAKATILSRDIVMGLHYLHSLNILHRDLKPSNVLYKTKPILCLKIADFGLSRSLDFNLSETRMDIGVGTRGWMASEVVSSADFYCSMSSDVFSCGLILHYLFSKQRHPFGPVVCTGKSGIRILSEREINILNNNMEGWNSSLPAEVCHQVKGMLEKDETQRPAAKDLLNHPMFWSDRKKMDLLSAVGNQPEFECPRAKRPSSLMTAFENELEAKFSSICIYPKWDDAQYTHMPAIYTDMTKPITVNRKGRSRSISCRKYDTGSVVELVRFISNTISHVSDAKRANKNLLRTLILTQCLFLKEFPSLVMEVYKVVIKHGWDAREEIQHVLKN